MKKITIFSSLITIIMITGAGCSTSPASVAYSSFTSTTIHDTASVLNTTTIKTNTIKEFLMGYLKDRSFPHDPEKYTDLMDIFKINHLTGNSEQPIDFLFNYNHPPLCTSTTTPNEIYRFNCLNQDTYHFEEVKYPEKMGSYIQTKNLFHNGKKVVTGICMDGASDEIEDTRIVNNQLAFTFTQNCDPDNPGKAVRNIYYNGETFNEKYGAQGTHYLFAYQNKLGFVIKKNNKEYIIFDDKIISPAYDAILTYGCCMNPSYLQVFKNGKLDFMAVKDEKDYLVEIDLNSYLE